jgi:hypothetical protein
MMSIGATRWIEMLSHNMEAPFYIFSQSTLEALLNFANALWLLELYKNASLINKYYYHPLNLDYNKRGISTRRILCKSILMVQRKRSQDPSIC